MREPRPRIGGVLYLLALGIFSAAVHHFTKLMDLVYCFDEIDGLDWCVTWTEYHAAGPLLYLEIFIQFYMLIFSLVLAHLFVWWDKRFPKLFIFYLRSLCILGLLTASAAWLVINSFPSALVYFVETVLFTAYTLILTIVWSLYFSRSKRAQITFVDDSLQSSLVAKKFCQSPRRPLLLKQTRPLAGGLEMRQTKRQIMANNVDGFFAARSDTFSKSAA